MRKMIAVIAAVAGLFAVLVPSAAVAAPSAWAPQPPGVGWLHGERIADLPLCADASPGRYGGWDIRDFESSAPSSGYAGMRDITRPVQLRLGEPCVESKPLVPSANVAATLRLTTTSTTLPIGSPSMGTGGGPSPWKSASFGFGPRTYTANGGTEPAPAWDMQLYCGNAEWTRGGNGQTIYTATSGTVGSGNLDDPTSGTVLVSRNQTAYGFQTSGGSALSTLLNSSSTCTYITRLDMTVCEFHWEDGVDDPVRSCQLATWWAGDYQTEKPYDDTRAPEATFCEAYPAWPGCAFIDPEIDPSSPAICGAEIPFLWSGGWLDFSFIPSAFNHVGTLVKHYAECLFVARDGFDRERWIANEYEDSALAAIEGTVANLADAASIDGSCGVIVAPVSMISWSGASTCDWLSWSGPVRSVLYVVVLGLSGLWFITFLTNLVTGTVNKRIPNPFGGEK